MPSIVPPPIWRSNAVPTHDIPSSTVILVCCHASRDARCGVHGPALLQAIASFQAKQLARSDLDATDRALWAGLCALPSSHVGGHEFAGNLIFYPTADWFGLIQDQQQVEELLLSYFAAVRDRQQHGGVFAERWVVHMGEKLTRHWRNACC